MTAPPRGVTRRGCCQIPLTTDMRSSKLASGVAILALSGAAFADDTNRTAGAVVDDAGITAGVKTKLIGDKDTKTYQINVETRNGVVQLNGFVDNAAARTQAEQIAKSEKGVTRVENNLEIGKPGRTGGAIVDDAAITMKVDSALAADQRTSALRVDVETNGGEVQLSGFATNAGEKAAAEEVAKGVEGVRTVSNKIDLR